MIDLSTKAKGYLTKQYIDGESTIIYSCTMLLLQ